jgi:hypothetical protein
MGICHRCGATVTDAVGVRAVCPQCNAYLHCCLNCRLYSASASNHCLSNTTEPVRDVEAANFCEEFEFVVRGKKSAGDSNRSQFDKLFGE